MADAILPQLKELLHYCPETGIFTWLVSRGRTAKASSVAGCLDKSTGYKVIRSLGKKYKAHRLAWLYVYGGFPPDGVDHINRVKTDNRICNLRLATQAENGQNLSIYNNNTCGHTGVSWNKPRQKWQAYIKINQKQIYLEELAALSRPPPPPRMPQIEDDGPLDLSKELYKQYRKAQQMLMDAEYDDAPLNYRTQTLNAISSIISQLVKLQMDLHTLEEVKKIEGALAATLKKFPEIQQEFLEEYAKGLA